MFSFLFAAIALGIPFLSKQARTNQSLALSVSVVLLSHQAVSFLQVHLQGLPTMRHDPLAFNAFALNGFGKLANTEYARFLHLIYQTFGASHLLGCQVSNVFFSLALLIQISLLYRVGLASVTPKLVLVFGLLPSCILNTSVTLREAAQMAFFLALVWILLDASRTGITYRLAALLPIGVGLQSLHHGFTPVLVLLIPLSLAWALKARPAILFSLLIVAATSGMFFAESALEALAEESVSFDRIVSGDLEYVEGYAASVGKSRTNFGVYLDLSSPLSFLKTGPIVFFYYLYSPLPWQIRSTLDFLGLIEVTVRLALTFYAVKAIVLTRGQTRAELILLLFMFFTMEAAWAAGTANWGTAFRHRLVAWGLLLLLGGKGWVLRASSKYKHAVRPQSTRAKRRALKERQKVRKRPR